MVLSQVSALMLERGGGDGWPDLKLALGRLEFVACLLSSLVFIMHPTHCLLGVEQSLMHILLWSHLCFLFLLHNMPCVVADHWTSYRDLPIKFLLLLFYSLLLLFNEIDLVIQELSEIPLDSRLPSLDLALGLGPYFRLKRTCFKLLSLLLFENLLLFLHLYLIEMSLSVKEALFIRVLGAR
jgi:hypothetical protein